MLCGLSPTPGSLLHLSKTYCFRDNPDALNGSSSPYYWSHHREIYHPKGRAVVRQRLQEGLKSGQQVLTSGAPANASGRPRTVRTGRIPGRTRSPRHRYTGVSVGTRKGGGGGLPDERVRVGCGMKKKREIKCLMVEQWP